MDAPVQRQLPSAAWALWLTPSQELLPLHPCSCLESSRNGHILAARYVVALTHPPWTISMEAESQTRVSAWPE